MNEQIPPTATWGKQFITAPLANRTSGDAFKIVASRDNTNVQMSSGIRLNDSNILKNEITAIPCPDSEEICAYSILVEGVSDSPILRHVDGMKINAISYWYATRVGYGYFAGMTQRPIACELIKKKGNFSDCP